VVGLSCVVLDALGCVGGQCTVYYPDKQIYGVPGISNWNALAFVTQLEAQATQSDDVKIVLGSRVSKVSQHNSFYILHTSSESVYYARQIILATGIGKMQPNLPATISGVESQENQDFVQCYCMKTDLYAGKTVVVAGGGDSAADFAIGISKIAKKVTILHRRGVLSCDDQKLKSINEIGNVDLKLSCHIKSLVNGSKIVTDHGDLIADHIVFCYGFHPSPGAIQGLSELGVTIQENLIVVDWQTMQTAANNIYAIGDAITYPNKRKNLVSCFYEADGAVRMIRRQMATEGP
jgi:thioredoxin reductase (NADPH)